MAKTRTPGITVFADGWLFIDKRRTSASASACVSAP
jgi:hypothetical protein